MKFVATIFCASVLAYFGELICMFAIDQHQRKEIEQE